MPQTTEQLSEATVYVCVFYVPEWEKRTHCLAFTPAHTGRWDEILGGGGVSLTVAPEALAHGIEGSGGDGGGAKTNANVSQPTKHTCRTWREWGGDWHLSVLALYSTVQRSVVFRLIVPLSLQVRLLRCQEINYSLWEISLSSSMGSMLCIVWILKEKKNIKRLAYWQIFVSWRNWV